MGDHYARDWFSSWDQRWYTGFTTVSYPPGTHMAMAALSKVLGSLELAFVTVQITMLLMLTIGVYRFSRLWVSKEAAANAALLLVASSAIAETVHLYGQLPTTFALAFLLNALPFISRWVFEGRLKNLLSGVVVLGACTAGHHVTTLFGSIFFLGPVLVAGLLRQSRIALPGEIGGEFRSVLSIQNALPMLARRLRRVWPATVRLAVVGPLLICVLVIVVMPYWIWSGQDPINQVAIPHGSRANFLADRNIGLIFFAIPWGLMFFVLPYALVRAVVSRMWPLAASLFLLFVLGTGGTTPVPRMLLGGAFDILTLDRFTFWAAIMILPLAGLLVTSIERGSIASWLRHTGGTFLLRFVQISLVVAMIALSLFSATLAKYRPFQPDEIATDPIVSFIEKDQHERWRYLTLGFGDQMARLSAQTTATQVDGNYHSARRLPELTSTSIERLEGAKYRGVSGLGSLQQFLEVPEKYNLKFVFSNDKFYDPLLTFAGWHQLGPLENGIVVWERADIEPLPAQLPDNQAPYWQRFMWGTIPPTMICGAFVLLFLNLWSSTRKTEYLLRANAPSAAEIPKGCTIKNHPSAAAKFWGPFAWIDRLLQKLAAKVETTTQTKVSVGEKILARVRGRISKKISWKVKLLRICVLAVLCASLFAKPMLAVAQQPTIEDVIETYYEDLDFRRFADAYSRLDPQAGIDYELWRLQLSVNGGLLASYAKLDSIDTEILERSDTKAVVRVKATYLTALDWYDSTQDIELRKRNGSWFIVPQPADPTVPPDQLVRRSEVDYLVQGRRRVTSATSDLADIQDRPEIAITSAQLVAKDDLPVVVGQILNTDVDPADLTVTAILRDADGQQIAKYNATDFMSKTLNPGETTPFRVDFQDVAAGENVDFDPLVQKPLTLEADIASVEVYAKAVVTSYGLYRGVGVNDIEVTDDGNLAGELRNDGTREVAIPMVLASYIDDNGDVLWVDRHYVPQAIRSQRSQPFEMAIKDVADLENVDVPVEIYANGIAPIFEGDSNIVRLPLTSANKAKSVELQVVSMMADNS